MSNLVTITSGPSQRKKKEQDLAANPPRVRKISYSELKIWAECSHKHKLVYLDQIKKFQGNEYTAFGTAVHHVCENLVVDNSKTNQGKLIFQKKFLEELMKLPESHSLNKKLISDMRKQGDMMIEHILPGLKDYFPQYEVVSVEEAIYQPITNFETDYSFKGFIDLILKTPDGKHHVIDWKTCSWGWDMKKRSDKLVTYQLTLYKNFYSLKYNIDVNDIETHFALLKRTNKKEKVEIFRVTSGAKKMNNALDLLQRAISNIEKKNSFKNRMSCKYCEFYKTEHCR
jgi:hypothetical protein